MYPAALVDAKSATTGAIEQARLKTGPTRGVYSPMKPGNWAIKW